MTVDNGLERLDNFRMRNLFLSFLFSVLTLAACTSASESENNYINLATVTAEMIIVLPPTPSPPQNTPEPTLSAISLGAKTEPTGKIVFTCQTTNRTQYNNLCLVDLDKNSWRQLTDDMKVNDYFASVAPEGDSVIYTSTYGGGGTNIFELNLARNSKPVQLTYSGVTSAPAISPDGERILYTYNYGPDWWDGQIRIADRDGLHAKEVTDLPGGAWDGVWSPDGSQILFASKNKDGRTQLFIMTLTTGALVQVTDFDELRGRNSWSANNLLATYAGTHWNREIILFDTNGNDMRYVTDGGHNLAPSFSPDGQWITFTSYRDHIRINSGCEIYIMRIDGTGLRRLTNNFYCDWQPWWGN